MKKYIFIYIIINISLFASLREKYNSRNQHAAKLVEKALNLSASQQHDKALGLINKAIQIEGDAPFYHYWKGIISNDLGKKEESLSSFKESFRLAKIFGAKKSISDSSFNLAITLLKNKHRH